MLGRLNHVAIAVPSLANASAFYRDVMGASISSPLALPEHGVTVVFVALENTKLELMEPLGKDSPIASYLQKNPGGGTHHVCYEVEDINKACEVLAGRGMRVLGSGSPSIGAHGKPVVFLHPKDAFGTLIELEQA
jgi:methylmalonyl-CoA/ethylmalonyl-CoA epimerase